MRCPHCGKENASDALLCAACGTALPSAQKPDVRENAAPRGSRTVREKKDSDRGRQRRRNSERHGGSRTVRFILAAVLVLLAAAGLYLLTRKGAPVEPAATFIPQQTAFSASTAAPSGTASPAAATAEPGMTDRPLATAALSESPVPSAVPDAEPTAAPSILLGSQNWFEQYERFLEEKQYLSAAGTVPEGTEPRFTLFDMDGNGTPELIAAGTGNPVSRVFTCEGDAVILLGELHCSEQEFYSISQPVYPGIFCTDISESVFTTVYFTIRNRIPAEDKVLEEDYSGTWEEEAEVQSRQLTQDDELFRTVSESSATDRNYLTFYSPEEILSTGWEGFVILCGYGKQ